jgi:hypothetical protein
MSKAKQRWRLMSLLRSLGRLWTRVSSSTPLVSCHLYCSYRLIRSLILSGSKRWDIHCSASRLLILISSNLVVVDCKYVWLRITSVHQNTKDMGIVKIKRCLSTISLTNISCLICKLNYLWTFRNPCSLVSPKIKMVTLWQWLSKPRSMSLVAIMNKNPTYYSQSGITDTRSFFSKNKKIRKTKMTEK